MPAKRSSTRVKKTAVKKEDEVARLRSLAHDLSNSLEAIMQASYLLAQSRLEGDGKRWAELIESSSQEAARINREIRKNLRAMSGEANH